MWKYRLVCLVYCAMLTLLLLVPDPAALLGIQRLPKVGSAIGIHFTAFAGLGMLVAAGRIPLRPVLLAGSLFLYSVGVELLQWYVPPRTVETRDLVENLLGLSAGVAVWRLATGRKILAERDDMPTTEQFRILTPEGLITFDTFALAGEQPQGLKKGCFLLVQQSSGRLVTVHQTRLIPVDDEGVQAADRQRKSPCLRCGRVEGVVGDEVVCPEHGEDACGLLEAKT